MTDSNDIEIIPGLSIPEQELRFTVSRSSKPGGQHVNKVSTRVTLEFDVENSDSLSDDQRNRILSKLRTRISRQGILRIVSQKHRSQSMNKTEAIKRFVKLVHLALQETRPRLKTSVPERAILKRLEEKKRRAKLKSDRGKQVDLDEY